jgi:LPXTG-motif cell wall-anchored protein
MKIQLRSNSRKQVKPFVLGLSFLAAQLISPTAQAEKFTNQFIEFEKPANWNCVLEGAEFVCQSNDPTKKKEAIIVFAAKLKGDQDNLKQYLDYLNTPKSYQSATGKAVVSEKKIAKNTNIKEHPWVDALHFESEIPGFYTRYFATVYEDIGVLVTYSVAKNQYQDYTKLFEPMVNTLRVFRKKGPINVVGGPANGLPQVNIGQHMGGADPLFPDQPAAPAEKTASKGTGQEDDGDMLPLLMLIALGAGAFIYIKKKRQGG